MRENVQRKGRRYTLAGRLTILSVDRDTITGECNGSGVVHSVGHKPGLGWFCSCPARSTCSHLVALWLVCVQRPSA
jgi:hypothetical protein